MNPFDDDVRESLRRPEPPPALADRVMAEIRRREAAGRRSQAAGTAWWRWGLAAAAVLALSVAPLVYVQRVRQAEGERAKEQVLTAFYVAGSSLRDVKLALNR